MLEQCCNYLKQRHNNVATLSCAKNRRWESSLVTSPLRNYDGEGFSASRFFVHLFAVPAQLRREMTKF